MQKSMSLQDEPASELLHSDLPKLTRPLVACCKQKYYLVNLLVQNLPGSLNCLREAFFNALYNHFQVL